MALPLNNVTIESGEPVFNATSHIERMLMADAISSWTVFGFCVFVNIILAVQVLRKYNIFRLLTFFTGIATLMLVVTLLAIAHNVGNGMIWQYVVTTFQIVSFDLFVTVFVQLGVRFYPAGMAFTPVCLLTCTSAVFVNCIVIFIAVSRAEEIDTRNILSTWVILGEIVTNFLTAYYVFSPLLSTIQGKVAGNPRTLSVGLWYISLFSLLNLANMIYVVHSIVVGTQFNITNFCINFLFRMSELLAYTLPPTPPIHDFIAKWFFRRPLLAQTASPNFNFHNRQPLDSIELNRTNTSESPRSSKLDLSTMAYIEQSQQPRSSMKAECPLGWGDQFATVEMGSSRLDLPNLPFSSAHLPER